jgi:hypothetical protein
MMTLSEGEHLCVIVVMIQFTSFMSDFGDLHFPIIMCDCGDLWFPIFMCDCGDDGVCEIVTICSL